MARLMQQIRDQVFDKKSRKRVERMSKACRKPELVENLAANLVENQVYSVFQTSVSETIRKPPLVQAQTALKTKQK